MEPNIRIKGFDGDWEQRSLGDIFSFQNGFNGGKEVYGSGIPLISVMDVLDDDFITYDKIRGKAEVSEEERERFSVNYGDVLFQRSSENVEDAGTSNVYLDQDHTAVFGGFVIRGRGISEYDPKFMKYCLSTPMVRNQFMKKAQGAQHVNISQEVLQGIRIFEPSDAEQRKISEMFSCLGQQISLQQQKVSDLKELKKYMLQKMFPKNGEKVPEIRFSGFEGEWEQRKLGDLVQFSKGSGYSKGDLQESGTPIILYGRLYTKYETVIADVDTFVDAKTGSVYSQGGEIIVPASGETAEDISIASVVEKSGVLLGGDLNIITPPADIDSAFLAISISNGKPHNDMAKMAQGKSVVHLHNSDLAKIDLPYPCSEEQRRISGFFANLDSLITHHQRKHDTLLEFKAYLLQNMFPKEV